MILAKLESFMRHVANKHDYHPDNLFPNCAHDVLESRLFVAFPTLVS